MYHQPVLLQESIDALLTEDGGWYADLTMGGGGHTSEFLRRTRDAKMLAFDQDPDAIRQIPENERLTFVPSNFRYLAEWLEYLGIGKLKGVLADLGVSTFQIDELDRGFTFRQDAELDMRMDKQRELTAIQVLNTYDSKALQSLLSRYGEVRNARTLAQAIVKARRYGGINTADDLLAILENLYVGKKMRYIAQVFQAIRIEVNDEMNALKDMLYSLPELMEKGGRLVVLSYHSIEDRIVKRFLKNGSERGIDERDVYGHFERPFKSINKKVVRPSDEEIKFNPRARSAKMRIGKKI